LAVKQIILLDEHNGNKELAEALQKENKSYFDYEGLGYRSSFYK
jgi:hypothetical protein